MVCDHVFSSTGHAGLCFCSSHAAVYPQQWCYSPNTCSKLPHSQVENVGMATIYIKHDNLSCWVGKVKNRLVQGRKWSLILVALMKCLFLNVKEVAWAVATKPVVTLRALSPSPCGLHPRLWTHVVSGSLSSCRGSGDTIIRCGICCWNGSGSQPGGEQSPVGKAGSGHGLWVSAECSGMSCLAALVLSYIVSSKVDSGRSVGVGSRWSWREFCLNLEKQGPL